MTLGNVRPLIVLDADGVFMNEMTYWRTALAAALTLAGIEVNDADRWAQLDRACLRDARLQRVTKSRACNSNWDFAAVMTVALADDRTRTAVRDAIAARDDARAARQLHDAMEALWVGPAASGPPIGGFGIDRKGEAFARTQLRFQEILSGERDIGWSYPRYELAPPADATRAALQCLHDQGYPVTVCTSRQRAETETPIRVLNLAGYFDTQRMATHDEVRRAQDLAGKAPLSKPHWFPLACAALGFERATEAVRLDAAALRTDGCAPIVFVGDASADFETARGCAARGLPVRYVHIDSGISNAETLAAVRASEISFGVVPDLAAAVAVILEGTA